MECSLAKRIVRRISFRLPRTEPMDGRMKTMPNLLPIEGDWQHLIEKRSGQDRRTRAAAQKKAAAAAARRGKDRRKSGSQGK